MNFIEELTKYLEQQLTETAQGIVYMLRTSEHRSDQIQAERIINEN